MISSSIVKKYDAEAIQAFDQLAQESLNILLLVTGIVVWGWAVYTLLFIRGTYVTYAFIVFSLMGVAAWLSYRFSEHHLKLAVFVYLFSLIIVVTIIVLAFQNPALLYLYMPVLIITTALTHRPVIWGSAFIIIVLILAINKLFPAIQSSDTVLPIVFILLTALVSYVNSLRLFTALGWAFSMTEQARNNADEARDHRAEVKRILKSLDEAYVRLKHSNQALILAQEAAEKAYRFKAEFVANVSHELRTPLNLIVGFSKMMATAPESYAGVLLPKEYRGDMMALYRSARHLSALIDDVLDLSQIEAGSMPLVKELASLEEVIREAVEIVHGLVQARGLNLEIDLPRTLPSVPIDRTRIRQVILNLLTNATRFTDRGFIRVQARREEQKLTVTVTDSGRGISQEKIAEAFEAFKQVEDSRSYEGSGLGLAVSKRFVDLHGGTMWIDSKLGHGTTIGFSLPIPNEKHLARYTDFNYRPLLSGHLEEPTVLVLHDDTRILSLLKRYVGGYQFALADSAAKALEMSRDTFPAAVVADTNWSNHFHLQPQALNLPSHIPLITCPLPSLLRLGSLVGAVDYLIKPVTEEDLQTALGRLPTPPQTILIVDDDPNIIRLFSRMLKVSASPLRILEAFGGQEGIEIARRELPDVMLLDLSMPDLSGYAVLKEVANDKAMAGIKVIIVSAHGIEQDVIPISGAIQMARAGDFSVTEILQILQTALPILMRQAVTPPNAAATFPKAQSDQQVL